MKRFLFSLLFFAAFLTAGEELQFSLYQHNSGIPGNTLLIIGGIQGDEPGGFMAASLVATKYKIKSGNVWVVPNLNFPSIIKSLRGKNGDMNRKFAYIDQLDPDFETVERIKKIITDPQVDLIVNLHDGSGFYRTSYISQLKNPKRWGQSCIIDQTNMGNHKFGNLASIAESVVQDVNEGLLAKEHRFRVKNTETRLGDKEMEKALTYFAIKNGKPAFANEASKTLAVHERVYYQLLAVESYLDQMGIAFERDFRMDPRDVKKALYEDIRVGFFNDRMVFDVTHVRPYLNYVPMKKDAKIEVSTNSPLIAVFKNRNKRYQVNYGSRRITQLKPQYFEYDFSLKSIKMEIDGVEKEVAFGEMIKVKNSFSATPPSGYRTNVIGFVKRGTKDESGVKVAKNHLIKRFSVDKKAQKYRVEVYKGKKFSGMVLVDFSPSSQRKIMAKR